MYVCLSLSLSLSLLSMSVCLSFSHSFCLMSFVTLSSFCKAVCPFLSLFLLSVCLSSFHVCLCLFSLCLSVFLSILSISMYSVCLSFSLSTYLHLSFTLTLFTCFSHSLFYIKNPNSYSNMRTVSFFSLSLLFYLWPPLFLPLSNSQLITQIQELTIQRLSLPFTLPWLSLVICSLSLSHTHTLTLSPSLSTTDYFLKRIDNLERYDVWKSDSQRFDSISIQSCKTFFDVFSRKSLFFRLNLRQNLSNLRRKKFCRIGGLFPYWLTALCVLIC